MIRNLKKIMLLLLFFLCSCRQRNLINDSNILEYESFVNAFLQNSEIKLISRNFEKRHLLSASNFEGEDAFIVDAYNLFFQNNKTLARIFKEQVNLNNFCGEFAYQKEKLSEAALEREFGKELLQKRMNSAKNVITLVCFQEYHELFLLGIYLDENQYVYSPDLDLGVLTPEELSVFGFAYANKTKFKNWFYTASKG